uniref:Uncharacterized protein n=1 Tax=Anguilla anguilla TaxID=7936 RepID=A0A0E9PKV9_ANGAN
MVHRGYRTGVRAEGSVWVRILCIFLNEFRLSFRKAINSMSNGVG